MNYKLCCNPVTQYHNPKYMNCQQHHCWSLIHHKVTFAKCMVALNALLCAFVNFTDQAQMHHL